MTNWKDINSRITINCSSFSSCLHMQVIIESDTNIYVCSIINYPTSLQCLSNQNNSNIVGNIPTNTPTNRPTNFPISTSITNIPTTSPVNTTLIGTQPPTITTETILDITPETIKYKKSVLPWLITSITGSLFLIILLAFICYIIHTKRNKSNQIIVNDLSNITDVSNNTDINIQHNNGDNVTTPSMESMYDKNLTISPQTKGTNNHNAINNIIQQNLKNKKNKNKHGEDSPAMLSPSHVIKNEGIILDTINENDINNNGILLEYNEYDSDNDVQIIIDDKKTSNTQGNV